MTGKPELDMTAGPSNWRAGVRFAVTAYVIASTMLGEIVYRLLAHSWIAAAVFLAWWLVATELLVRIVMGAHARGRREGERISLSQMSDLEDRVRRLERAS